VPLTGQEGWEGGEGVEATRPSSSPGPAFHPCKYWIKRSRDGSPRGDPLATVAKVVTVFPSYSKKVFS